MSEHLKKMTGLEQLQHMIDLGAGPAIARTLGFVLAKVGDGWAVFEGTPNKDHFNPAGTIHGGWAATIMDSALACAIHSKIPAGKTSSTIELKINYVRPMTDRTGLVTCRGEILHMGRTIATSDAKLVDANGKLYAHGTCTCMIYDLP